MAKITTTTHTTSIALDDEGDQVVAPRQVRSKKSLATLLSTLGFTGPPRPVLGAAPSGDVPAPDRQVVAAPPKDGPTEVTRESLDHDGFHETDHQRAHDDLSEATQAESTSDTPPALSASRLTKPILIPRVSRAITSPLVRAWAPSASALLPLGDFLSFIDGLNEASKTPPFTAALQATALGVSFIPWDGADGIAAGIELGALALAHKLVSQRCKSYIAGMNEEYFHPRGLHARLLKTPAMRGLLGVAEDDTLLAELNEEVLGITAYERCMRRVQTYSCELSTDVPEKDAEGTAKMLARFATWNTQRDVRKFDSQAKQARKWALKRQLKKGRPSRWDRLEKSRLKHLQWLLVQNLDECELEAGRGSEESEAVQGERVERASI